MSTWPEQGRTPAARVGDGLDGAANTAKPDLDDVERRLRLAIDAGNTAQIDLLGAVLDGADNARLAPALLPSALWYAERGLRVFPLTAGSKVPLSGSHGCKDATADPDQIRDWWEANPTANIGIATGDLVDVIDVDGPVGVKSWSDLIETGDVPPRLGVVNTPRPGGSHHYVAATGKGNRAGVYPGIDHRGRGGFVVAPPSVNAEGVRYSWTRLLELATT
jgi:hypothetical protein